MPEPQKKNTKREAGYLSEDHGPFECGRCIFFITGGDDLVLGKCEKVGGEIDYYGCCNLFQDEPYAGY